MSKSKTLNVAKALTSQLHVTEEAIDTALAQAANLIETYVSSRRAAHISTVSGNNVHQATLKAMMALSEAQKHMTDAHNHLSVIGKNMGIDIQATGPGSIPKPDDGVTTDEPVAHTHENGALS